VGCHADGSVERHSCSPRRRSGGYTDTKTGTYTVDEDTCTITVVLDGYLQATTKLLRKTVWQFFFADNGKEVRGISRKLLYYPNGYPAAPELNLLPVITMIGTRFTPAPGRASKASRVYRPRLAR